MIDILEIEKRVYRVIGEILEIPVEEIGPELYFQAHLGADSLDLVEIIMELEEEFGEEISDEDAQRITSVGEAIVYIYENQKRPFPHNLLHKLRND